LNEVLPEGYFAEPNVQFGIEIDVATYSEKGAITVMERSEMSQWTPQAPTATLPFQPITDVVEVQVFSTQAGPMLVGAIELVSPANKDRPASRDAFTSKCQTYLQQSIGLIVVDIVTTLNANLHNELMARLRLQTEVLSTGLYAISYRVAEIDRAFQLEFWQEALTIARSLPILPLYLKGGLCLPINLEDTYQATCIRQRIL
jgi:hypothetical protein